MNLTLSRRADNLVSRPATDGVRVARSILGAVLFAAILLADVVCERVSQDTGDTATDGQGAARDELIRLTPKRLTRTDLLEPLESRGERSSALEHSSAARTTALERSAEHDAPGDEWRTETLSALTSEQLTRLFHAADPASFEEVVAPGFRCGTLRPRPLRVTCQRGPFTVYRAEKVAHGDLSVRGAAGLAAALLAVREGLVAARVETRFKTVGIELPGEGSPDFTTRVFVAFTGPEAQSRGLRQATAVWACSWHRVADDATAPPSLVRIRVERYTEVRFAVSGDPASRTLFADATTSAMGGVPSFAEQQLRGIEHWSQAVTRLGDMSISGHHGLSVGDVNGDGLEDLYVCDGGSLTNRLYVQNPDGTVRDVSRASGVDWLEDSRSSLLVDLDGDGDQDLVVATIAVVAFAENDGSGKFTLRGGHRGAPYPFSLSAADYDSDGDLDIHVCVYAGNPDASARRGFEARAPIPFHDARNGGRNVLLENLGSFRFADVTGEVGLDENNSRWSFAAAWEDFDRDGDPDLYVANDFGRNSLYRNDARPDGGRAFEDIAATLGVEDIAAGMSVAWGDYDRDGRMDLYVGNMFSSAGKRIAYQRNFSVGHPDAVAELRRMARGNSLFAAVGDSEDAAQSVPGFADVSESAGVTMGRWAWSSGFVDVNNDGWEDIVIANGYLTNTQDDDL